MNPDHLALLRWHCVNETAEAWLERAGDRAESLLADLYALRKDEYEASPDKRPGIEREG